MKGSRQVALTTFDNPFNPFDEFEEWFKFDNDKGYGTCGYLDRVTDLSDQLSDQDNWYSLEDAIDEAIALDFRNIYTKVYAKEID